MSYQRHPLEIGPLVFGLVFLGVVAAWGLFELGVVTAADTAWILPVVLIGAGALGVVLALTKPRRTEARDQANRAAAAAYAGKWTPADDPEQAGWYAGSYADTADRDHTGAYANTAVEDTEVHDDTHEQTATTDQRSEDTDTGTGTGTDPNTYPTDKTETRERHDD
jgi:hypothetical protein